MQKENDPCLTCDCYDSDMGCTMPSVDKAYACSLEDVDEAYFTRPSARWKGAGLGDYMCSLCGEIVSGTPKYCPNCEAKMDE